MKFNISLRVDNNANNKIILINEFIDSLEKYFATKGYGSDVEYILIGLTCVYVNEGFEHLYKVYPLKYVDFKILKNKFTGESIELKKQIHYSVKLNNDEYEEFVNGSDEESKKILYKLLFDSLSNFDALPKKIKDFDKERFKTDLESFLIK